MSVDYVGLFRVTPRGSTYILFFTDRFGWHADMYTVFVADLMAESTANVLVNKCIPPWGCLVNLFFDDAPRLPLGLYKLLLIGARNIAANACYPNGNGGAKQVYHTMAQMLAIISNERLNDWDVHLPHPTLSAPPPASFQ